VERLGKTGIPVDPLKAELHRAGFAPTRAVAYRDASGEVVYTAPVYGP